MAEKLIPNIFSIKRLESLLGISITKNDIDRIIENRVCSLWSGYGGVYSIKINLRNQREINLICKVVNPPNNVTGEDHERKLKSYRVEIEFYQSFGNRMLENEINLPKCLTNLIENDGKIILLMHDLHDRYPLSLSSLNRNESYCAIDWIAKFHAFNWEQSNLWESSDIWLEGCYWRLDTRLQEYNNIGKKWKRIKAIAYPIANLLRDGIDSINPRRFRTIIHGDYKVANILFQSIDTESFNCASYDYQYTGIGFGTRDLVMLIVSSIDLPSQNGHSNHNHWKDIERSLLEFYYHQLLLHLANNIKKGIYQQDFVDLNNTQTNEEINSKQQEEGQLEISLQRIFPFQSLLDLYELSLVDYFRFMLGWGMWGNTTYIEERVNDIITQLDNGVCLTPEEYAIRLTNKYVIHSV